MNSQKIQPEYLFRLARSGAPKDRKILARSVVGIMHGGLNATESALAEDILLQLLQEAEADIRMALAEQLAHEPNCPKALLDFLIYENAHEISDSLLRYSEALSDEDLIQIVQHFDDTRYWQSIARRRVVNENVTRYLVGTDDKDVYRLLVKNRGVEFCPISLDWIVQVAANIPEIQAPLLQRPEVTPELAAKLYWHVSSELRAVITSRFDINIKQIDGLLDKMVKYRLAARAQAEEQSSIIVTPNEIAQAQHIRRISGITSHQLLEALQKEQIGLFYCLWAGLLDISPEIVQKKMQQNPVHTLAVLCRLARITARHYNVFFLLWRGYDKKSRADAKVAGTNLGTAMRVYDDLGLQKAHDIMRSWMNPEMESAQKIMH